MRENYSSNRFSKSKLFDFFTPSSAFISQRSSLRRLALGAFCIGSIVTGFSSAALAADFAASVAPPRFELRAKPGEVLQQVLEIRNESDNVSEYRFSSADWDISPQGSPRFYRDALQSGSCRPWVRIERRSIKMTPRARKKYRFEVHVPANAANGECRFALMIEGKEDETSAQRPNLVELPINGSIGVIIYVTIGNAGPDLQVQGLQMTQVNGRQVPAITLHNAGNAHGRPSGILTGIDRQGRNLEFAVSPSAVLPGQTRTIPIWPQSAQSNADLSFAPPLRLQGLIEWDGGQYPVDMQVQ